MTPYRDGSSEHPLGELRSVHRVRIRDYVRSPRSWILPLVIGFALSGTQWLVRKNVGDALLMVPLIAFGVLSLWLVPVLLFASEVCVRERGVVIRRLGKRATAVRFDDVAAVLPQGLRLRDGALISVDPRLERLDALRDTVTRELR